jgi:hypothetical protein
VRILKTCVTALLAAATVTECFAQMADPPLQQMEFGKLVGMFSWQDGASTLPWQTGSQPGTPLSWNDVGVVNCKQSEINDLGGTSCRHASIELRVDGKPTHTILRRLVEPAPWNITLNGAHAGVSTVMISSDVMSQEWNPSNDPLTPHYFQTAGAEIERLKTCGGNNDGSYLFRYSKANSKAFVEERYSCGTGGCGVQFIVTPAEAISQQIMSKSAACLVDTPTPNAAVDTKAINRAAITRGSDVLNAPASTGCPTVAGRTGKNFRYLLCSSGLYDTQSNQFVFTFVKSRVVLNNDLLKSRFKTVRTVPSEKYSDVMPFDDGHVLNVSEPNNTLLMYVGSLGGQGTQIWLVSRNVIDQNGMSLGTIADASWDKGLKRKCKWGEGYLTCPISYAKTNEAFYNYYQMGIERRGVKNALEAFVLSFH